MPDSHVVGTGWLGFHLKISGTFQAPAGVMATQQPFSPVTSGNRISERSWITQGKVPRPSHTYTAVTEHCSDTGLYVGHVPGLPGAHSQGETLEELNANLHDVMTMLLDDDELVSVVNCLADI